MNERQAPVMIDLRLLPAAASTWAATWWATSRPPPWPLAAALLVLCCVTSASYAYSRRHTHPPRHARTPPRSVRMGVALLCACLACTLAVAGMARQRYDADPARREAGPIRARVVLEDDPAPSPSGPVARRRARVRITEVFDGIRWAPSQARALVSAPGWEDAARGDVFEVTGTLDPSFASAPPSVGAVRARRASLIERPGGVYAWMRVTHRSFVAACETLPGHARALVPGMAVGDARLLRADLAEAMKMTSLTHLTAVSGSHIVIILAALNLVLPARKVLRLVATAVVLCGIVILVGPQPSVLRSVCVAAVACLGLILGREGQAVAALSGVVIVTLLLDPWASRSYGFALSCLAALALVGPSASLIRRARRRLRADTRLGRAVRALVEGTCVPALAEVFTAPLIVSLSGTVPVWGIAANVLAEPAVPLVTLAGLAGALLAPVSPTVASACAWLASWGTAWIAALARFFSGLPASGIQVPGGPPTLLSLYACAGAGWGAWAAWRRWGAPVVQEARGR